MTPYSEHRAISEADDIKRMAGTTDGRNPSVAEYTMANDRLDAEREDYLHRQIRESQRYFIPREKQEDRTITGTDGESIATAIDTQLWRARMRGHFRDNTFEEQGYIGLHPLFLVVDFDDVLNRTTEYQEYLKQGFAEFGLDPGTFDELYRATKKPGTQGKDVFDYFSFIEEVKKRLPDRTAEIDSFVEHIDYKKFVDQSVMRALEVIRATLEPVKITLLTHGDTAYQRMRVEATGVDKTVDEIIYSEGSKREVLEALRKPKKDPEFPNLEQYTIERDSFILTVDDNPDQLEDFAKTAVERHYANLRYRHPSAKRHPVPTRANEVVELEETDANEAALNLYRSSLIAQRLSTDLWRIGNYDEQKLPDLGRDSNRTQAFEVLKNPQAYPGLLERMKKQIETEEAYIRQARQPKK